jgi:hypothetical protein
MCWILVTVPTIFQGYEDNIHLRSSVKLETYSTFDNFEPSITVK